MDSGEIRRIVNKEVYSEIATISDEILKEFPDEVIAKEKLVKSLYQMGEKDKARSKGEDFLEILNEDEIILVYMSKIERDSGNLESEKEYLERIIEISHDTQIMKKLGIVNSTIKKEKKD